MTDAKDAFAVGHHNDVDIWIRAVSQKLDNGITQRIRNDHAARSAVDVTELLTRQCNRRRVNNRRHFLDVLEKKAIEENLVVVLQRPQIDVPLQIVILSSIRFIRAHDLLLERFHVRGKQAVKTKLRALFFSERCSFVQQWRVEQIHSARHPRRDDLRHSSRYWLAHIALGLTAPRSLPKQIYLGQINQFVATFIERHRGSLTLASGSDVFAGPTCLHPSITQSDALRY